MRLFAEQGFAATTVGDIEAAVGLQPRRGTLYKHYRSKEHLLHAAVDRHLDSVRAGAEQVSKLADVDLENLDRTMMRDLVVALGWWFLSELDRQRELTRIFEHDGDRLQELVVLVRHQVIDTGNRAAADILRHFGGEDADADAIAVLLLGSLVAQRRTAWTFGDTPLSIDDQRAINAWADLCMLEFDHLVQSSASGTADATQAPIGTTAD